MANRIKVLWTPFEGRKRTFSNLSEASKGLGISYASLISKSSRTNTDLIHTDEYGKLEKCD